MPISGKEVLKKIYELKQRASIIGHRDVEDVLDELIRFVDFAPTIEERKTGRWEIEPKHPMDSSTFAHIKCTECGERPFGDFPTLYCPNCGAKME